MGVQYRFDDEVKDDTEELVHAHTKLVLRESLDDTLRDLLPWDIELVIDESVDEKEEEPEV